MRESQPAKRAYVETYGCQMNVSDGELMEGVLAAQGYEIVDRPDDPPKVSGMKHTSAIARSASSEVLPS